MSIVKLNNRGVKNATAFGSITGLGSMTFIKKLTASSSANLSFVDGSSSVVLDSTYKEYLFTFNNIHPQNDSVELQINFRDGGSSYDATKTTTVFMSHHAESDAYTEFSYDGGRDLAQSTSSQKLMAATSIGGDNDQSLSGFLHLFDPSNTTFVKHFIVRTNTSGSGDSSSDTFIAGYCNVTAAIDGVQFDMSSGNIDAGDICLYGIN
tara:strand:- start:610 stop:1233 length:624 start_codon:yes stop_codon:yes gene_type:complete